MIHIVYGTRAELIKFSPLIKELGKRKIDFKLVDTGDHNTERLRKELGIPTPHHYFGESPRAIWSSISFPLAALLTLLWGAYVFSRIFTILLREGKVVVYHNNTKIVPLAVLASKLLFFKKLTTIHYESGLRGKTKEARAFDLYAKIGDMGSKILFAPTKSCIKNLKRENVRGKIVYLGSPIYEVVHTILKRKPGKKFADKNYVLINSSRSIYNKNNAAEFINLLNKAPYNFVISLNPRVKYNLQKFGLFEKINSDKIIFAGELNYTDFIHAIKNSRAVITDSQGVQEECAAIGKTCVVTNDFVQFPELVRSGIVKRTGWDSKKILSTLKNTKPGKVRFEFLDGNATKRAADILEKLV